MEPRNRQEVRRPRHPEVLHHLLWKAVPLPDHQRLAQRGLRAPDTVSAAQLEAAVTRRWPSAAGAAGHWRRLFEHLAYRDQGAPGAADLAALRRRRRAVLASLASPRRAQ